jgi:hypothetical protein
VNTFRERASAALVRRVLWIDTETSGKRPDPPRGPAGARERPIP